MTSTGPMPAVMGVSLVLAHAPSLVRLGSKPLAGEDQTVEDESQRRPMRPQPMLSRATIDAGISVSGRSQMISSIGGPA